MEAPQLDSGVHPCTTPMWAPCSSKYLPAMMGVVLNPTIPASQHGHAGATPADVATKARHPAVARYLREAAEGRMPASQPTKEALIERFLSGSSSGNSNGTEVPTHVNNAAGIQQEGPAESRQLAAAEGGQAAVDGACISKASPADSLDGKSGASSAAHEPAGAPGRKAPSPAKLAAARQLAKRGFEGWGTQGEAGRAGGCTTKMLTDCLGRLGHWSFARSTMVLWWQSAVLQQECVLWHRRYNAHALASTLRKHGCSAALQVPTPAWRWLPIGRWRSSPRYALPRCFVSCTCIL